jgi:hypothetical protein
VFYAFAEHKEVWCQPDLRRQSAESLEDALAKHALGVLDPAQRHERKFPVMRANNQSLFQRKPREGEVDERMEFGTSYWLAPDGRSLFCPDGHDFGALKIAEDNGWHDGKSDPRATLFQRGYKRVVTNGVKITISDAQSQSGDKRPVAVTAAQKATLVRLGVDRDVADEHGNDVSLDSLPTTAGTGER